MLNEKAVNKEFSRKIITETQVVYIFLYYLICLGSITLTTSTFSVQVFTFKALFLLEKIKHLI